MSSRHLPPLLLDGEAVATRAVSKRFGRVDALRDVSLAVSSGITFGLLGPNASGKTTLIRLLAGVLRPDSGDVRILGRAPAPEALEAVGYMPQSMALYPRETVWENMRFFARIQGVTSKPQMMRALALAGLANHVHRRVSKLSIGMQRRVSLACVLVHEPRVLLLDEPTVGLDPEVRVDFWNHFRRLNDEGVTIVVTTHTMDEAERCHRLGILREGRLLAEGSPRELRESVGASRLEEAFLRLAEVRVARS